MLKDYRERMQAASFMEVESETKSRAYKTVGWAFGSGFSGTLLVLEAKGILPGSTLEVAAEAGALALTSIKAVYHATCFNIAGSRLTEIEENASNTWVDASEDL